MNFSLYNKSLDSDRGDFNGIKNSAPVPLSRRSIHDDVDPKDLHGVQGVGEIHQRHHGDEGQRCNAPGHQKGASEVAILALGNIPRVFYSRAQLETHKVLDIVVDSFSLLDG